MKPTLSLLATALCLALPVAAQAASVSNVSFINGLAIAGSTQDLSSGSSFDRRVGFFSDLYYDPHRKEWWGLSDRGPGGGTLQYETRLQRFSIDIGANGAISNFQVKQTVLLQMNGLPLNGLAPNPANKLGLSFDPEGLVINPLNGNLLISDEYGPSLYEFDRSGQLVRLYNTPANLVPKTALGVDYNASPSAQNNPLISGREGNRGMEGLAISPDGKYAYGMLQNGTIQDGWSVDAQGNATRGAYTRIVKYDTSTGAAVAQYAYKLEGVGQGRGISAIVALGNDKFLVLERNNRGIGVGANPASPDKNVFEIDLAGAVDVSDMTLPASGNFVGSVAKVAKVMDLDANTLAALGNKSPEKWEGLAVGPKLASGEYLVLAGTDNDYSVTQNGSNTQFDVYFRMSDTDPYAGSIQCPLGDTTNCSFTTGGAATPLLQGYELLPGVLHAYTARIDGYTAPVPEPQTYALMLAGLGAVGWLARRRRH
jgi:hypothetical protein